MCSNRTYPSRPWIGVGVIIFKEERVLLVRRAKPPWQGEWSLPGGAQLLGETIIETGQREVMEETGLEIDYCTVVAVADLIDRDENNAIRYHYTLVDLTALWQSGEPSARGDVDAVRWVLLTDLNGFNLWGEITRVIHLAAMTMTEKQSIVQ